MLRMNLSGARIVSIVTRKIINAIAVMLYNGNFHGQTIGSAQMENGKGESMADRENVINELNECIEHIRENEFIKILFWGNCQSAMMDAIELLKGQPPTHIHEERSEHEWERDDDGNIDMWAWEDPDSIHHGPGCRKCYYSFCIECDPNGWDKKPCVVDWSEFHAYEGSR